MRALLFTTGSPFARAVRIVLEELGLDYERREEITTPTVEERAAATPTLQVPVLWDGGVQLWESGLTAEYLLRSYPQRTAARPPLAEGGWRAAHEWQDRLVLSTIQTLGTAITTISQMKWAGVGVAENAHLQRSSDRLSHLLGWLEDQLTDDADGFLPDRLSLQDIFLACHIRFAENRPIGVDPRLSDYPKIAALLVRLDQRASFRNCPIRWWEPGVTDYESDGSPIYAR